MGFSIKNYWQPTPKRMRQIGDGLVAASAVVAAGGVWQYDTLKDIFTPIEIRYAIGITVILCAVGKFLTNCFKEETPNQP